jgi:hypothetical protein
MGWPRSLSGTDLWLNRHPRLSRTIGCTRPSSEISISWSMYRRPFAGSRNSTSTRLRSAKEAPSWVRTGQSINLTVDDLPRTTCSGEKSFRGENRTPLCRPHERRRTQRRCLPPAFVNLPTRSENASVRMRLTQLSCRRPSGTQSLRLLRAASRSCVPCGLPRWPSSSPF